MNSVTMISWELDPFHTRGGTAYAIRRLADQLTGLGVETRVLLPDCLDRQPDNKNLLLKPVVLKTPAGIGRATRGVQCREFARCALDEVMKTGSDVVVAHSLEGALFTVLHRRNRLPGPSVFWLHSLYDPVLSDLPQEHRQQLPHQTLLASAVSMADVVVTSSGILKETDEFEWPQQLKELQKALEMASHAGRVLTVESMGCLPSPGHCESVAFPVPYVLFPGRPSVDKGLGIFAAIAERLQVAGISCVAVKRPTAVAHSNPSPDAPIHWLPWLAQDELVAAMRGAACTVLPSITEGFGLAAAESITHGVTTLYQDVGGHRSLSSLPNARPVPITQMERVYLYRLWAELFESNDYWSTWSRYEGLLTPLIDRWVDEIHAVISEAPAHSSAVQVAGESWGRKLIQRLEQNTLTAHA